MDYKSILCRGKLTYYISLAVVIVLPLYVYYLPPFMILWGLAWFLENDFKVNKGMFLGNRTSILFFLFIGFYLWQILGLLLADSLGLGFERLFKRLSFFLFPFVLFYPGEKITKNIILIIRLFAICTFIYLLYCFGNALHHSFIIHDGNWIFNPHPPVYTYENYFYGYLLSHSAHPSYLSMYIVLSILISLESLFDKSLSLLKKCFWSILLLVFLVTIYLLSSRAGMLAAIILLPIYFFSKLYERFSRLLVLVSILVLVIAFIGIARTNSRVNYFFEGTSHKNLKGVFEKDTRHFIWDSALGVIRQNIILGVGTGNASEELKKEFISRGYVKGYYDNLNAHNQYIEILLENGLIGLILFMAIFGYMIYIAVSERNILYGLFIIMMIVFFFFETILNRLAGVTFFPLFSFLLLQYKSSN
jgi:O-antigen ligase